METTEETPNLSKSPSPESKSIAPEHVSEDEPNSLNGDGGMVVVKHFTDSGKEKTEKTEKEGSGNKPVKDNGLVIHDISKEIAKVDTDDSESADDILNDINSNQGLKRKASEAVEDGGNDNSNNSVNVSATIRSKEDPVISDSDLTIEKQSLGKGKRARIPNKRYSDILISPNQRSKIENGSEKIESEDSSNKEEPLPPVVVQSNKRRVVDMKNPKFLKPFQLGWKREMVWRASSDQFNKIAGDIYYYAPTGKKIRSMRELSEALKTTKDLTIENFTFMKEAVGLNDPEKEIIRDAKKPNSAGKKVIGKSTKSSKVASPKIPSTKVSSPKVSKAGPTEGEGKSKIATKKLGNFKVKAPSKSRDRKNRTDDSTEIDSDTSKSSKGGRWTSAPNSESSSRQRGSGKFSNAPDITHSSLVKEEPKIAANYLQNVSYLYKTLLCVFQYLKVQDLVKAGSVCSMWYDAVNHRQLWQTVRMKNSQIHCFEGLTNMLKKHGTVHLDLRKMLFPTLPRTPEMSDTEYKQKEDQFLDDFWSNFPKAIEKVTTLRKIDLCRCPAFVVEKLAVSHPDLEVLNAVSIKCEKLAFEQFSVFKNIQELRIKSTLGLTLTSGGLDALKGHKKLTHLSLTSIRDLNKFDLSVIAELPELVLLELGECTNFPENFGETILIKLKKLEKLRLEKGQDECHTFEILNTVKIMPKLEQLELVNFDIKQGFDKALGECVNIKKLLLIPTYISQSATTNHMVLGAVIRLQHTLTHFVWGVTLELLRVTELFVGQLEEPPQKKQKVDKSSIGQGDCIPVLKPIPFNIETTPATGSDAPQVEILPLPQLQLLLMQSLPKTRVKILKIPFHATWRQTITDPVS